MDYQKTNPESNCLKCIRKHALTVTLILLLFLSLSLHCFAEQGKQFQPPDEKKLEQILNDFEKYVEKGMKDREIPGMAIAIVRGDEIIYKKGFGVRRLGEKEPVNEETLFQIGSTSKAFTAALAAMMADEGKFGWNDPVTDHLPDFRMFDPWVTREFRVQDLMAQHSGMPPYSGDFQSFLGFDRNHIIHSIRHIKPVSSFRLEFAYQNNLFLVAAQLVEKYSGKTWEENLQERIFTPLGMTSTTADMEKFLNSPNMASLHNRFNGKLAPFPKDWHFINWTKVYGPAGGIHSNVIDMSKWLRLNMHGGKFNGKQLVGSANLNFLHSPKTIASMGSNQPKQYYCQGWVYREYSPYPIIWHNGGTTGHNTMIAFVPNADIGIVAIANRTDESALPDLLAFKFFDMYFDKPEKDWNAEAMAAMAENRKKALEEAPKRPSPVTPAMPNSACIGEYENDVFGRMTVSAKDKNLIITLGPNKTKFILSHWNGNMFMASIPEMPDGEGGFILFHADPEGNAESVEIDALNKGGIGIFKRVEK